MRTLVLSLLIAILILPSAGCNKGQRDAEAPAGEETGTAAELLARAEEAYTSGNYDEAFTLLEEIPKDAPESARAHNLRGLIHAQRGNTSLATLEFKEALSTDPKLGQAHNNLGVIFLEEGRLDLAIESFEAAVAEDPYYAAAHRNLAEAYYKTGKLDRAKEELKLVEEIEAMQAESRRASLADLERGQPLDVAELIEQEEVKKEAERKAALAAQRKAPAKPTTKTVTKQVVAAAGTRVTLALTEPISTASARPNQEISARVVGDLIANGDVLVKNGAAAKGRITEVESSGRVKGRAKLAFAFDRVETVGGWRDISAHMVEGTLEAEGTKKQDAAKIGIGAAAGAVLGEIIGDKAGTGAIIGGAAGTALVLSTKGKEIELEAGAQVDLELDQPLAITIQKTVTASK